MNDDIWSVELGRGIGVIDLGATKEDIAQRLAAQSIELDVDDEDDWLWVEEINGELHFKTIEPRVLWEITVEDERVRLGPMQVIGKRLHEVVELLQVGNSETLWRKWGDEENDEDHGDRESPEPQTDEELLDGGTLWIPPLGLGLQMSRGEIDTIRLRKPQDAPRDGLGPLTSAQRELSTRKDLPTYLRRSRLGMSGPVSWVQVALNIALVAALALLFWRAIDYQRRWNDAPTVEGQVIAVKPPPPEPFPREFTVAYRDQAGGEHQVVFKPADVYIVREVGEKVDVRYLPDAPDQPLGPARVRDAAFLKFTPWAIGVFVVYVVLQILLGALGLVMRKLKAQAAAI